MEGQDISLDSWDWYVACRRQHAGADRQGDCRMEFRVGLFYRIPPSHGHGKRPRSLTELTS
jgi:hypothetical protein